MNLRKTRKGGKKKNKKKTAKGKKASLPIFFKSGTQSAAQAVRSTIRETKINRKKFYDLIKEIIRSKGSAIVNGEGQDDKDRVKITFHNKGNIGVRTLSQRRR